MDNRINIDNSQVEGDFIGRDDKSINIINHNTFTSSIYLQNLYECYQKEKLDNPEFKKLCEELDYFNSIVKGDVMGLEEKLRQGGRERLIAYALDVKEKFHKKLIKTSQFSNIAQDINVYLLSKVHKGFMMDIYHLICEGESDDKINLLINERIIKPVQQDLGINPLKYNENDIMGMIFFLTGNCHIKWN